MPGPHHEAASKIFGSTLDAKLYKMGLLYECCRIDSTLFKGRTCGKMGDLSWRPFKQRPDILDWPSVVVECGVSQTQRSLRTAAKWWLSNSGGDVKKVVLIHVEKVEKKLHLELWGVGPVNYRYHLRGHYGSTRDLPKRIYQVDIVDGSAPVGASLTISFEDLLLRPPVQQVNSPEQLSQSSGEPAPEHPPQLSGEPSLGHAAQLSGEPSPDQPAQLSGEPSRDHHAQSSGDHHAESSAEPSSQTVPCQAGIEQDIVLTKAELEAYAQAVWNNTS